MPGSAATNAAIACWSAAVIPESRLKTTNIGSSARSANFACSSLTLVDSAEAGRNDALSFFCTELSWPDRGPRSPPSANQTTSATADHRNGRRGRRSAGFAGEGGATGGAGADNRGSFIGHGARGASG